VARQIAETLTEHDVVVIIIPDSGTRYLSKIYNDNWMKENQFLESQIHVRAGQVVREKARRSKLVFIPLGVTVQDAVNLMREHDISQVPVMEGGEVVGSISEARILDILVLDPNVKTKPVAEYMETPFPVVAEDSTLTEIANRMDHETPAILVKVQDGYDIITKSDLIFFLTKQSDGKQRN
jgi:cystathionine beta-synthase